MAFEAFSPETAIRGQRDLGILSSEVIQAYAARAETMTLEDGEYLFLQGTEDDSIYLVISGEIELVGNEFLAGHERVGMYGSGDIVGADAHLVSDVGTIHHLSAKASGPARILKLSASILQKLESESFDTYERLRQDALVRCLEQAPSNDIVSCLMNVAPSLNTATCPVYQDGETIFSQNEPADFVYLLVSGSVRIEKEAADGSHQMVARLRPGQLFGEAGVDDGASRRASALVEGSSCMLKLSVGQFRGLMEKNATLRDAIDDQKKLYTSRHHKYRVPRFVQNMKVATRIAVLTLFTVLTALYAVSEVGIGYVEKTMRASRVEVLDQKADYVHSSLESQISAVETAATDITEYVLSEHTENPEELGNRSHRSLGVYYVHGEEPQLPAVPVEAEAAVRKLLERVFSGEEVQAGFVKRRLENENIAFFRVQPVATEEGDQLGLVLSTVYPAGVDMEQTFVSASGSDTNVPGFPGRLTDLHAAADGRVEVNDGVFGVSRESISHDGIELDVFAWRDLAHSERVIADMRKWAFVAMIACAVISSLVALALSSWTLQPIYHLSHALRRLSEGQRGIVVPFASRENEVGVLANAIHQLQSTTQKQERIVADRMNEQQRKVQRQEENKRAIAAFRVRFDDLIGELFASVETVSEVSEKLLAGSNSASDGTGKILETFHETRESVEKVESLARELRNAAQQIDTHTETSDRSLGEAVRNMKDANETIQQLNHVVDEVGSIAGTISSIADQTRLLALNATIEASRAGRAGKGFGVVASEVSNLANQTSEATDDIRQKVENIETASLGVVSALSSIDNVIERMRREHTEIRVAVETQTEATRHIADDVGRTSQQAREVSASLDGISQLVAASKHGAEDLSKSSALLKDRTDDIGSRIETFLRSVSD